jgi:arylsulfatase A-like enzyme
VVFDGEGRKVKLPGYRVDALTDAAIRYVDDHRNDPFFLFLSFLEPHHQNSTDSYPAAIGYEERLRDKLDIPEDLKRLGGSTPEHFAGYMGMVARLDEAFGRLIEALTSLGLMEDTIILFTSDHGCHFKTRNDEYKRSCHESSIRVPTLLHGPGFTGRGRHDGMVSLIDLPPTLIDAAGLDVPAAMQGRSLLSDPPGDDVFVQISEHHVGRALRTRRWKYEIEAPELDGYDVPGAPSYIEARLYDLDTDPHELENLVASPATRDIRKMLATRLKQRIHEAGEPIPEIVAVEDPAWSVRRAAAVPQRTILGSFAAKAEAG